MASMAIRRWYSLNVLSGTFLAWRSSRHDRVWSKLKDTSSHSEHRQPCFLPDTAIVCVFSESGVISHTLPHVLTSPLWGMEGVSILLCLQTTLPSFSKIRAHARTHTHTSNRTHLNMQWDRQVDCQEGIKKGKKWRSPFFALWVFEKRAAWVGRQATVNGKKWTRFTGGCDRKRLFLTRHQSQSELQIHHFWEAGRRRGRHLRIFTEEGSLWRVEKKREKEGFWVWLTALHLIWAARSFFIWLPFNQLRGCRGLGGEGLPGCLRLALMCHVTL